MRFTILIIVGAIAALRFLHISPDYDSSAKICSIGYFLVFCLPQILVQIFHNKCNVLARLDRTLGAVWSCSGLGNISFLSPKVSCRVVPSKINLKHSISGPDLRAEIWWRKRTQAILQKKKCFAVSSLSKGGGVGWIFNDITDQSLYVRLRHLLNLVTSIPEALSQCFQLG